MKTLYQTKNPELIAPLNKITPPPPNSHRTRLNNKGSHLKYLFLLKQLTTIVFIAIAITSCNVTADNKPSSLTEVTSLTLIINSTDYPVTFTEDKTATIIIPPSQTIPAQVTVKTITVSEGAEGPTEGESLPVTGNLVSLIVVTEDQITRSTYTIKLVFPPLSFTAIQLKVTDGSKSDGSQKLPSNFMIFDIIPTDTVVRRTSVQFLLVKNSDAAPTTPNEFQKTVSISLTDSNSQDKTSYKNHDIVMAHSSVLFPAEKTSLYLGHDSEGNYPLSPNTEYGLYALQPESADLVPSKIGTFTTGSHPILSSAVEKFIEDPGTATPTGHFYMKIDQFFVWVAVIGRPFDWGNDAILSHSEGKILFNHGAPNTVSPRFDMQTSGSNFPSVFSLAITFPPDESKWIGENIKWFIGWTGSQITQFKVFR